MAFVFAFIILHLSCAASASAQPPPQTGNRFLFIINTSSAMRRMTNGIQEAVLALLNSGMQGQMRDGDTFGIWTYDDQLHTDFPMKVWSKQNQGAILETVAACLAQPRYQKRPRLDKVLPAARQLIAQSRVVTLIFIFDGAETMQGTGFDKDINDLHKEFGRQVRADNIPFVTVLAARDGKVFDYRVRTPASVSLPQTADLFMPAETNTLPAVAAANVPPPAVVAPKPPEPRHLEIVLKPTLPPNPTPPVPLPAAEMQSATNKPEPVVQPAPTLVQPAPTPVQPPTSVVVAPVEPAKAPVTIPPATQPRAEETRKQSPNTNPNLNPPAPSIAAPETSPPSLKPGGRAGSPLPAVPPETPPRPVRTVAETPVVPALPTEIVKPVPTPHPAPLTVPTAVALPSPADHLALLVIAFALVTIAVVLVLFLIRRSRTAPSLISQSMDRPQ